MMAARRYLAPVLIAALAGCATNDGASGYLPALLAAEEAGTVFAPITAHDPAATMAQAYGVQRRYVEKRTARNDRIAGYKGGLMSQASLKGRNVTEPLVGVLFSSGRADAGATVSLCGYRKASFELKLGYILPAASDDISSPLMVAPVIDLPDIAYRDPAKYSAVDMVAANISIARYVVGTPQKADDMDLDSLTVSITRDSQSIASGRSSESIGGQSASLDLVQALVRRAGYRPSPGDLIVTGKMGDRGWLLPGDYVADYGRLGMVRFTIAPCPQRP